jgi:hypothetical protein
MPDGIQEGLMGLFDTVSKKEIDDFKAEIAIQLAHLDQEIKSRATDSDEKARSAAENVVAIEEKVKSSGAAIDSVIKDLESYKLSMHTEIKALISEKETITNSNAKLRDNIDATQALYAEISAIKATIDKASSEITEKIKEINSYLSQSKDLPESVAETNKLLEESKALNEKIANTLNHSINKKSEIDKLAIEIIGQDLKSDDGKIEHIDGLKDNLERSYNEIASNIATLNAKVEDETTAISNHYNKILEDKISELNKLISISSAKFSDVKNQLTGLLPGAMAEGLSAAYEKKKDDESTALKTSEEKFILAICLMALISLIPFSADFYLLGIQGKDLVQVIKDTPSLVVAIFPLYFPVLWMAYAANKRINLSKRLIEEYTHKAVLGKTFSGLSNQIDLLPQQSDVKEELRTQLLFNILQVSAENPGKLISNYNKSDHPLMDALENSAKLSDAVDSLSRIPGFSSLAKKLGEKTEELLEVQRKKVEAGLSAQVTLSAKDGESSQNTGGTGEK